MSNIVFKEVYEYDLKKILKFENQSFFEIRHEPTCEGHKILLCNKKKLTFEEIIKVLEKSRNRISIQGAMSFIYYNFCSQFYFYILNLEDKTQRRIIKKTEKYLIRWNMLAERSDDLLYPQNEIIKKLYKEIYQTTINARGDFPLIHR